LGQALDAPSLAWTTSGNASWVGQTQTTHDGQDAAASGTIGHLGQTSFQSTFTGPGTVSFWWKVSSEANYDFLRVQVDGTDAGAISGEVNWQQRTLNLSSGAHTIHWRYAKDANMSSGHDRAWVDQVTFTPGLAQPVVHVDWRYTGANPNGSLAQPFRTVAQGYASITAPATLKIRNGNYRVDFVVTKPVLLEPYDGAVTLCGSESGGFVPSGDSGAAPQPPTLGAPRRQSDGTFAFRFVGSSGVRYRVLTTTNLVNWTVWKDFVAETDTLDIVDPEAAVTPHRFFKVVAP
jgi:hypothetical protein